MTSVRVIDDPRGAVVEYFAAFLGEHERRGIRSELEMAGGQFDRDRISLYGRTIDSPRLVCAFGDDGLRYRYAGVDRATHPWPAGLRAARDRIAALVGHAFNYALVNWYRSGDEYIGWHADKVSDLTPGSTIASLSLGAARPFQLRDRAGGDAAEVVLADGSLLLMRGTCQQFFKHCLPRRRGVTGVRYNVTFRSVVAG